MIEQCTADETLPPRKSVKEGLFQNSIITAPEVYLCPIRQLTDGIAPLSEMGQQSICRLYRIHWKSLSR